MRWLDQHPLQGLVVIACVALSLNVARLWLVSPTAPSALSEQWWSTVLNLVQGRGYTACLQRYFPFCGPGNDLTAAREPLPILLFAGLAAVTNASLWMAGLAQAAFNLATLCATFALTRAWAGRRAALLAALFWGLYWPAVRIAPEVHGDLLAALLTTAGIWLFLRARQTRRWREWLAAGVCLGLACLSRSALLAVVAALVLGLILTRGGLRQRAAALMLGAAALITFSPWVIRNAIAFHQPVLGSTLTGYNLYRHNYILGTDQYLRFVASAEGEQAVADLLARHPELTGKENEAQMDAFYRREAFQIIAAHPDRYGLLSLYRALPLWLNWQVQEAYGSPGGVSEYLVIVEQVILVLAALLGLTRAWRRTWPLWISIAALSLAYMAVVSQLRYLVPVMPLVISLSAAGLAWPRAGGVALATSN